MRRPNATAARALAALAALAATCAAAAADVRGGCRDGTCYMLRLERVQPVDESNLGRLLFVKARTWSERDGVASDPGGEDGFAFCSARAPALVTVDGERVRVTWLAPQSPEEASRSRSPYILYFEACHGAGAGAAEDVAGTAERLGYAVDRRRRETVPAGEPQDVLRLAAGIVSPRPRLYGWPGFAR